MTWRLIICSVSLLLASTASTSEFQKWAFMGPYGYIMHIYDKGKIDTAGLDVASYFAQLDSLGITVSGDRADSLATSNPYGVKIWGQCCMPEFGSGYARGSLSWQVHVHHKIPAEAENSDAGYGYSWTHDEGSSETHENSAAWFLNPSVDNADTVMRSDGIKFVWKYTRRGVFNNKARFRMASGDSVTTDTICDIIIKHKDNGQDQTDIYSFTGADFGDVALGSWKTFETSTFGIDGGYETEVKVYWRGNDSLWIDKITILDNFGEILESVTDSAWDQAFVDFYASIDTSGHDRFYPTEETMPSQFWGLEKYDDHASDTGNGPGHRITQSMTKNVAQYIRDIAPVEVVPLSYPVTTNHSTRSNDSTTGTSLSIQLAYNTHASRLQSYADSISGTNTEFWLITQSGGFPEGGVTRRQLTTTELRTLVYLGVLYGIRGIGYFTYSQMFFNDSLPLVETNGMKQPADMASAVDDYGEAPDTTDSDLVLFNGLVDWNAATERYEPNERWHAADTAHKYIDSVWLVLDTLTWHEADDWKAIASISAVIDSIYSTTFHTDSTYVHIGRWTNTVGDEFYGFLNRRTLASDSQNVVIELRSTYGAMTFYDVYEGTTDTTFDSCGTVRYTAHFDPGELRLFKVENIEAFAGSWEGTWPHYSTINVIGDITVDSGNTLTIETSGIDIAAFSDSETGGGDSTKIEFRISGNLRLEGSTSNRIELGPDTTADSSWWGIKILTGGHAYIDNAVIKNAYTGLELKGSTTDTVMNTRFQDCQPTNLYTESDVAYIYQDTFALTREMANGYGIYAAWADNDAPVTNCFFENIRHPIRLYSSDMAISDCEFVEYDYHYQGSGGYPAIAVGFGSDPTIDDCVFNNSVKGVYVETNCDVEIDGCEFKSDSTNSDRPFMYISLLGTPNTSSCEVRNSCFKPSEKYHVSTDSTAFDLGLVSDSGMNTFHVENVYDLGPPKCTHDSKPDYAVNNGSDTTVEAKGNWWDGDAHAYWIPGTVDTTPSLSSPGQGCSWSTTKCEGGPKVTSEGSDEVVLPLEFAVRQNYPNPFNPVTVISFDLPKRVEVNLEVYNVLGQRVVTLVDRAMDPGVYEIDWAGTDESGNPVSTGVYLYRLKAGEFVESKKMVLIK